jgi:alpha-D-xyloside xylohydrolase
MAECLRGGLSLGLSGFAFWSHDIGGFEGTPSPALFKRWIAFGLLSSHSRLHGSHSYRVPWTVDEESVEVLRTFTRLKLRLMPYVYRAAVEATRSGVPVMRAMVLEYPSDPAAAGLDRQYMLGPDLLVAPVFSEDGVVEYWVPPGLWTHFLTGEVRSGPGWVREQHGPLSVPLFARPGSLVPISANEEQPDADWSKGLTLELFALEDGGSASAELVTAAGKDCGKVTVQRRGSRYDVRTQGVAGEWRLRLVGISGPASATGGRIEPGARGLLLAATGPEASVSTAPP